LSFLLLLLFSYLVTDLGVDVLQPAVQRIDASLGFLMQCSGGGSPYPTFRAHPIRVHVSCDCPVSSLEDLLNLPIYERQLPNKRISLINAKYPYQGEDLQTQQPLYTYNTSPSRLTV